MGFGGGGGSKSVKIKSTRYIPPPTAQEREIIGRLVPIAEEEYYKPSASFLELMNQPYTPSPEFVEAMKSPYVSMLPFKEKVGDVLNQLAQRGVLGSTITSEALNKLGRWMVERGLEARTRTLAALEEARRAAALDAYRRALAAEEAKRREAEDKYSKLFNIWRTMYAGRMGVPSTYVKQTYPSSGGLLSQVAGEALGTGLGYWLGAGGGLGKIFSGVGKAIGGLFGGLF